MRVAQKTDAVPRRSLPDLRTVDEQGGPRCPHGHAGYQGNRAKAAADSGQAGHSDFLDGRTGV